jgi:hypothetical protein
MGTCVIGAPCDSYAISSDVKKYLLWVAARCPAGQHAERYPQDVIADHAPCLARSCCASVALVRR